MNAVPDRAVHRLRGLRPQLRPAGRATARTSSRRRLRLVVDPGREYLDVQDRPGPEVVRREPATSEDARWTSAAAPRQPEGRRATSASAISTCISPTPRSTRSAPRIHRRSSSRPTTPNTQILHLVPPDPPQAHLGEPQHRHRREQGRRSSAPARTRRPNGSPASTSASSATRTTGDRKAYEDEIFIQFFKDEGAMTEALKSRRHRLRPEHDLRPVRLAQGPAEHRRRPSRRSPPRRTRSRAQLQHVHKPIKGGGASTKALRDPAFRDALGYAIDKPALVDKVLGGHGIVGSTIIPPALEQVAHRPDRRPRRSTSTSAKAKLDAAGYKLDASGKRLDKEGKPIVLRMAVPDSSTTYSQSAEFITGWWKEIGIDMTIQALDGDAVSALEKPPEGDPPGKANFDVVIWNWAGDVDPNSLLKNAATELDQERNSDTFFSNPRYDELMALQHGDRRDQAQGLDRRDAAARLRPGAVPRPVLRRRTARLADRPVRGLAPPARGRRPAVLRLRQRRLQPADGAGG